MTNLTITYRDPASLVPYAKNSRTHSAAQVAQIAASIREFGFTNPVLIDAEGGIIAGHGRVLAAAKLKLEQVPTITLSHLTEAQRRALVIADNKIAENAGWDFDLLKGELARLADDGYDLTLIGFDSKALNGLVSGPSEGLTDPDDLPLVSATPVSEGGDIWLLGKHRIICGSAADGHTVEALLGKVRPHLMVTDPPSEIDRNRDWREAWALFPGDVAYVWHEGLMAGMVADSLMGHGFVLRAQIVWAKEAPVTSRGNFNWQHEACWYVVRKGSVGRWSGDRKQTTLWRIPRLQNVDPGNGDQKPVECMKRPIANNSAPGQAVYDPFCGTGTTIIAGEMTGRSIYAVELNPVNVDLTVRRWEAFTGQQAIHEATGQTFEATAAARGVTLEAAE